MRRSYKIANVAFLFESEIDIKQDKIMESFAAPCDEPDFVYRISSNKDLPPHYTEQVQRGGSFLFSSCGEKQRTVLLRRDGENAGREYVSISSDESKFYDIVIKESELCWAADMYYLRSAMNFNSPLLRMGAVTVHASFVAHEGEAILFLAPSGGGKTTQANNWHSCFGAEIINGDRAVIAVDGEKVKAFGFPVSGTSAQCKNLSYPIKAAVLLTKGEKNAVHRCTAAQAFQGLVVNAAFRAVNRKETQLLYDAAVPIINAVPFLSLECVADESAAKALFAELQKL